MRFVLPLLIGCTPFTADIDPAAFAPESSEVAFPGSRVTGSGVLDLETESGIVAVPYVIQEDLVIAGMDMVLGPAETVLNRSAQIDTAGSTWDCTVPYELHADLPDSTRDDFLEALEHWTLQTSVRFVEDPTATDRIEVRPGDGCWSYVGRIGGAQAITLSPSCGVGSAVHEIGHAMGFFHEQARSDADQHVQKLYENIPDELEYAFHSYVQRGTAGLDVGGYDLDSIMHYGSGYFAESTCTPSDASGCSLLTLDGDYIHPQRTTLSATDVFAANERYTHCGEGPDAPASQDQASPRNVPDSSQEFLGFDDTDTFEIVGEPGTWVRVTASGIGARRTVTVDGDELSTRGAFQLGAESTFVSFTAISPGPYTLLVATDEAPAPAPPDDHGNDVGDATWVQLGDTIQGTLDGGDTDVFSFEITEAGTWTAAAFVGGLSSTLYDDDGNELDHADGSLYLSADLEPGIHHLFLTNDSDVASTWYQVTPFMN